MSGLSRSLEELERELRYYRQEYDEIGADLLRAREEQGRVAREARRSRIVARLIREAHQIAGRDIAAETIGEHILVTVADTSVCERAALLKAEVDRPGWFIVEHALAPVAEQRIMLGDPPDFLFTAAGRLGDPAAVRLAGLLGTPFILWSHAPESGRALLLGNRSESNIHRPFEAGDRELVDGTLAVYIDVLLRKRADKTLQEAKTAAEEANSARARFLATLSHELRTPLNAIIGFSELLLGGGEGALDPNRQHEFARQILDAGSSLLALVKDILDFSSLSNTVPRLRLDWVPVRQLLATATRAREMEAAARGLRIELLPSAPTLQAMIDYDKFRQILSNLLGNAIKFTRPGGLITVSGVVLETGELDIAIRDKGIGIRAEDIPRILEPFVQLDGQGRHLPGAGLGLPIAKQLTDAHHGRLLIESVYGEGTSVHVVLPAEAVQLFDQAEPATPAEHVLQNLRRSAE